MGLNLKFGKVGLLKDSVTHCQLEKFEPPMQNKQHNFRGFILCRKKLILKENIFLKNWNRVIFVIYKAVRHIRLLKMTFGWLFGSGNLVSSALRKNVSFFPSSVEKNYHGK